MAGAGGGGRRNSLFRPVKSGTPCFVQAVQVKLGVGQMYQRGPNLFIQSENSCNEAPRTADALSKDANQDHNNSQSEQLLANQRNPTCGVLPQWMWRWVLSVRLFMRKKLLQAPLLLDLGLTHSWVLSRFM